MFNIKKIDHIGIRIREKQRSVRFYESLGFNLVTDTGFGQGHPIMMRHASGIVLNLPGPSPEDKDENVLMDVERKFSGYTHIALKVDSIASAKDFLKTGILKLLGILILKT